MSLDVYLTVKGALIEQPSKIYVRENGDTKEISEEEWRRRFPDREPVVVKPALPSEVVFSRNITHNLGHMADEAGLYQAMWEPKESGFDKAGQLIQPLRDGLAELQTFPEKYKVFNPSNGWGTYDGLVAFVAAYLAACEQYPEAEVDVSR